MENFEEIILSSSNGKNEGRKIKVDKSKVKLFENQSITYSQLYETFDNEKFIQNAGKKPSGAKSRELIKTALQFYTSVEKIKNPIDKRQSLFVLGNLKNEDGSASIRVDERLVLNPSTYLMKAIIINLLENKKLEKNYLTYKKWAETFGLINKQQIIDIKNLHNKDFVNKHGTNIVLQTLIDEQILNENSIKQIKNGTSEETVYISCPSSESHLKTILTQYDSKVISFIIYRLKKTLQDFENDKLISMKVKYKGELISKNSTNHQFTSSYDLDSNETVEYLKLYNIVKEEYSQKYDKPFNAYNNHEFQKMINEKLEQEGILSGLETKYFKYIYPTYSIELIADKESIQEYIENNPEVKSYLNMDIKTINEMYINYILEAIKTRNNKGIEALNQEIDIAKKGFYIDLEEFINDDLLKLENFTLFANEVYELAEKLLNGRHKNNLELYMK